MSAPEKNRAVLAITLAGIIAVVVSTVSMLFAIHSDGVADRATTVARQANEQNAATNHRLAATVACIKDWADQTTTRSDTLTTLNAARNDALTDVVLDTIHLIAVLIEPPKQAERDFPAALRAITDPKHGSGTLFTAAAQAYTDGLANNPIPQSPKFACN